MPATTFGAHYFITSIIAFLYYVTLHSCKMCFYPVQAILALFINFEIFTTSLGGLSNPPQTGLEKQTPNFEVSPFDLILRLLVHWSALICAM